MNWFSCFYLRPLIPGCYSNAGRWGNSQRRSPGLFHPFSSMCCPAARDCGVAGEAYVLWPCMCFLIRCKMGPWPLCQGPWQRGACRCRLPLPLRPRLSLPAQRAGRRPLCLKTPGLDPADWRNLCHFMPSCTGSRCTVPKQVFMLPARRRQRGG